MELDRHLLEIRHRLGLSDADARDLLADLAEIAAREDRPGAHAASGPLAFRILERAGALAGSDGVALRLLGRLARIGVAAPEAVGILDWLLRSLADGEAGPAATLSSDLVEARLREVRALQAWVEKGTGPAEEGAAAPSRPRRKADGTHLSPPAAGTADESRDPQSPMS